MNIKDFSSDIFASALRNSQENNTNIDIEIAQNMLDIMSECGEIVSYEMCPFKMRRTSLTAYSYNEDLESLDLFLFSKSQTPMGKISIDFVIDKYDELNSFYREALRSTPFYGAELSDDVKILDKSEVARLAILWNMKPYLACKSKEVVTVTYFNSIRNENDVKTDSVFYRNIVSLHILFNEINNYVKCNYVRLFGTYTSRITYYVISSIAYITEKKFDLFYIWSHQEVQNGIVKAIKPLVSLIHNHLFEGDYRPNYLKDEDCWEELKKKLDSMADVKFSIEEICSRNIIATNGLSEDEKIIDKAISIPAPTWKAIAEWGKVTGKLSMAERLRLSNYAVRHRALEIFKNVRTAKCALELEEKARKLGFSIDKLA